ncbi:neutral/alkaline non-lysosomal ceramidase N-terminal domain-containing protein [Coprothermobacter platensis]|uniref:neutral/alkaline non-lysosomal ceramidase N-terminal domain-containing protein n=1 Tax=Coprothermobacter platensis TaxID=108819 RepID=UPI00036FEE22|nr:neutral/alkaline non-lysosomal ceramidase N-terminal domain-containing protein [Coprothermobacter platensis]
MMRFGFSEEVITPPIGVQMAGFIGERKAEGVHDDLHAKSLYIELNEIDKILFIALDTLAISYSFTQHVAERVSALTNIPKDNILIAATHTHSGPEGLQSITIAKDSGEIMHINDIDDTLLEYTEQQAVKSAVQAVQNTHIGNLYYGECPFTERVFGNRREAMEEPMPTFKMLMLSSEEGKQVLLYNFGCHPTVLHEENHFISADFPGQVASILRKDIPSIDLCMFLNGAAGDMSTRFYRQQSSFEELNRISTVMAQSIERCISKAEKVELENVKCTVKTVPIKLKIKKMPEVHALENMLEQAKMELEQAKKEGKANLRPWQSKVEGVESLIRESKLVDGATSVSTAFKIIKMGNFVFAGIPGELFSTLGKEIEEALKPQTVFVVGYCTDYIGYIPDKTAYEEGGYETLSTLLEKGEGERLIEMILQTIKVQN